MAMTLKKVAPKVRICAYQCGEGAWIDLQWTLLTVTVAFADRLRTLLALTKDHGLSEIKVVLAPDQWGPNDAEDEGRVDESSLVVTCGGDFWFHGDCSHTDNHFESTMQNIETFLAAVAQGQAKFGEQDGYEFEDNAIVEDNDETQSAERTTFSLDASASPAVIAGEVAPAVTDAPVDIEPTEPVDVIYECDDCEWKGGMDDMDGIPDVLSRGSPGEFMAAGCCPECGGLISIDDRDIPEYTLNQAVEILASRRGDDAASQPSEPVWTTADAAAAQARGWELFESDGYVEGEGSDPMDAALQIAQVYWAAMIGDTLARKAMGLMLRLENQCPRPVRQIGIKPID